MTKVKFPTMFENSVDAANRALPDEPTKKVFDEMFDRFGRKDAAALLQIRSGHKPAESAASWLKEQLLKK
jgi:hypothetical protein